VAQCCGRARKVESSYRGVGSGCSQTSRPGRVAMVLEKMKHDCGKGPVGMSYGSECSREVSMALGMQEIMMRASRTRSHLRTYLRRLAL
jgi:hypothetical protein